MNAVVEALYRDLGSALDALEADPEVRAIVLTGSPRIRDGVEKPAFCAGADLKEHGSGRRDAAARRAYIEAAHRTVGRVFEFPKPVIAAVGGPARGAGTELALACDLVLVADEASLGLPEVSLGTSVGGGLTWILPRLVGLARAKELVYTGRVVIGREAVTLGLATRSVPAADLLAVARELATTLARQAPISMGHAKRLLHASDGQGYDASLDAETEAILDCMDTEDWAEGVRAFAERRAPRYRGR
jgi:enoyl-CoA hydratase